MLFQWPLKVNNPCSTSDNSEIIVVFNSVLLYVDNILFHTDRFNVCHHFNLVCTVWHQMILTIMLSSHY